MITPLAWLQLSKKKALLFVALAGIGFADILMFIQLGFQKALLDSSVSLIKAIDGDIFLVSPQSDVLGFTETFTNRRLYQSLAVEGVESVDSLYLNFGSWKNPINRSSRNILVIGINPANNVLDLPGIQKNLENTKLQDYVIFDDKSRPEFGDVPELLSKGKAVSTEVASHKITVGGVFSLGVSFAADANIITSDVNFLRIFSERQQGLIDIGIINLTSQANRKIVLEQLRQELPNDVNIFSKEEFIQKEVEYWKNSTGIGFIFAIGTSLGFVVGTVIVYQILYTDITNHLAEYSTLKAMGYQNRYFIVLVFQQAAILALLGFLPGFFISSGFYLIVASATGLPVYMNASRAIVVLIVTIIMCSASGSIAIWKLLTVDPADIF